MKIVTVVGARPQFIKCAPVSEALRKSATEKLVHTGQHYDDLMSDIFFRELGIPKPDYSLGVGSGSHGRQTGRMLAEIESILEIEKPDLVMIYGDTNSTLAGALAAVKMHIPVAHVEAGLRSFNRAMPEEINRIIADHVSELLLCPTTTAVENLRNEGISKGVELVGDVMYDALIQGSKIADRHSDAMLRLDLAPQSFALATVHRAENTDDPAALHAICGAFRTLVAEGLPVVFPMHPRTRARISDIDTILAGVTVIDPLPYLDMLLLQKNARVVLTDSGGVQKEAVWLHTPCVTMRNETEWVETIQSGWNTLVGADPVAIVAAAKAARPSTPPPTTQPAADRVVGALLSLPGHR